MGAPSEILNAAAEEINAARGRVAHVQPWTFGSSTRSMRRWPRYGRSSVPSLALSTTRQRISSPLRRPEPTAYEAIASTVMDGAFFTTLACGRRWIKDGRKGSIFLCW